MPTYKSGEIVPDSGIYEIYHGKEFQTEATCVKGERFPPTKQKGSVFNIVHKTGHGANITSKKPINNFVFVSGNLVPKSGIYGVYNSEGKKVNEVTSVSGERFPAVQEKDCNFKPLHYAHHSKGESV